MGWDRPMFNLSNYVRNFLSSSPSMMTYSKNPISEVDKKMLLRNEINHLRAFYKPNRFPALKLMRKTQKNSSELNEGFEYRSNFAIKKSVFDSDRHSNVSRRLKCSCIVSIWMTERGPSFKLELETFKVETLRMGDGTDGMQVAHIGFGSHKSSE